MNHTQSSELLKRLLSRWGEASKEVKSLAIHPPGKYEVPGNTLGGSPSQEQESRGIPADESSCTEVRTGESGQAAWSDALEQGGVLVAEKAADGKQGGGGPGRSSGQG